MGIKSKAPTVVVLSPVVHLVHQLAAGIHDQLAGKADALWDQRSVAVTIHHVGVVVGALLGQHDGFLPLGQGEGALGDNGLAVSPGGELGQIVQPHQHIAVVIELLKDLLNSPVVT